jgi:ribonuclease P protein component
MTAPPKGAKAPPLGASSTLTGPPPLGASSTLTGPQTLPRAQRIRKRAEFVRIQQSPARVTTQHLLMLLSLRAEQGPARLGVVASRKVGPAVVRNRGKRLVREAFRRNQDIFPKGLDVVIVVRPGIHRLTQRAVDDQVRKARPMLARRAAELAEQPNATKGA